MKIGYELQTFHNIVLFRIFEMDEKYRGMDTLFECSNGLTIMSISYPELTDYNIKLRGRDKTNDSIVAQITLDTPEEAKAYMEKVRFALEEWNKSVEIVEIEYDEKEELEEYPSGKYKLSIFHCEGYSCIEINKNGYANILAYYVDDKLIEGVSKENTIIMFNRDCELLDIPFRLK